MDFKGSEVKEGKVKVNIQLDRKPGFLILTFDIEGTVSVMCDRCLEYFDQKIETNQQLIVKFTDEQCEKGDDIIFLPPTSYQINVAQYIYEYIILAIPMQRIHPTDENGESGCNPEMIHKLEQYLTEGDESEDSPWDKLKNLFDN